MISLAAVFWMSRNAPLRDIQKNGCEGDYAIHVFRLIYIYFLVRAKHARDKNDHACAELKATHDRAFSHDVTAAILVSQNNETAAMLVSQTSPVGVEFFSYVNAFYSSNKFQRCWPRESYF